MAAANAIEERFKKMSQDYERLGGGCTRRIAAHMISIAPRITAASTVLDNASGTGILVEELLAALPHSPDASDPAIHAADPNEGMLGVLRSKSAARGWDARGVTATVAAAEELGFADATFSHSFTCFGFMFFKDPVQGAREVFRTLKPGGTAVVSTWLDLGYIGIVQEAERRMMSGEVGFQAPIPKEWFTAEKLEQVLRDGGFEDVKVEQRGSLMSFESVDALAGVMVERFDAAIGKLEGEKRKKLLSTIKEVLVGHEKFLVDRATGEAAVKMVAHVAVARR